jgi:hypothetical protein
MDNVHNSARDQRLYNEAADLWRELYGEPPPIRADGVMMLEIIMKSLPEANYERLRSPHLRSSALTFPKPEGPSPVA